MSRPLRINMPDLIYHVVNRGNNRQVVFTQDIDYEHYLGILKRYKEKFQFKVFAYCLMTNHIHLLLKTSKTETISNIMKAITIAHTRYYHHKYTASGHVWQGRFKSPIVSDDEYLLTLMRYIEQNPVRAGITASPEEYIFSSCRANLSIKKDSIVDKEDNPVLLGMSSSIEERIKQYKAFTLELLDEDKVELIRKSLGGKNNFASEKFQEQINALLSISNKRTRGRPRKK